MRFLFHLLLLLLYALLFYIYYYHLYIFTFTFYYLNGDFRPGPDQIRKLQGDTSKWSQASIIYLSTYKKGTTKEIYANRCSMLFLMHKHTLVIKTNKKPLLLSYIHLFLLRPLGHRHTYLRQKAQQCPMLNFLS